MKKCLLIFFSHVFCFFLSASSCEVIFSFIFFLVVSCCIVVFDLTLVVDGGVLVLLVLRHEIVHVALGFSELHLVHTLTSVPVEEGLATEHGGELLSDALEHFLDAGVVADEGDSHLEALWWDVANGCLDVVWNPLDEVGRVLVLDVEHLLVDFLGGHAAAEESGRGEVAAVAWVRSAHHVLGVEHLLCQLWNGECTVLLRAARCQRSEAHHEEVETWEWNQVDGDLAQVGVELTWEAEAACDTGHDDGDEMVQVTEGWCCELEGPEADVVQSFVVNAHRFVGVLDKLVDGQGRVVWLDDGVGHLWRWNDGEGHHDAIWVLLAQLGDEQRAHTRACATTEGVADLEALEAIARLSLLAAHVEDGINELSAFGVMALRPIVTGTCLTEDEVVWTEDLAVWSSADGVHRSWLEVHQDCAWHVASAGRLVEVDVDALELEVAVTLISSGGVHTVLIGNYFPEFGANLVAALTTLNAHDLAHVGFCWFCF